jgi:hypothetical protein
MTEDTPVYYDNLYTLEARWVLFVGHNPQTFHGLELDALNAVREIFYAGAQTALIGLAGIESRPDVGDTIARYLAETVSVIGMPDRLNSSRESQT